MDFEQVVLVSLLFCETTLGLGNKKSESSDVHKQGQVEGGRHVQYLEHFNADLRSTPQRSEKNNCKCMTSQGEVTIMGRNVPVIPGIVQWPYSTSHGASQLNSQISD